MKYLRTSPKTGFLFVCVLLSLILLNACSSGSTPTALPQATATASPKPTLTFTPAPTATFTPVPTNTPIPTPTITPLPTATPTPTPSPLSQRFNTKPGDKVQQVAPGFTYIRREASGPLKILIFIFDLKAPEFDLKVAVKGGNLSNGVARTSELTKEYEAIAGVNGDLFSGAGLPQGMSMSDSNLMMAPKFRATFAWSKNREPFIGYFTDQWTWNSEAVVGSNKRPLQLLNSPCLQSWLCLYNEFFGSVNNPGGGAFFKALIDPQGYVLEVDERGKEFKIPPNYHVLLGRGESRQWLKDNAQVGEKIDLVLRSNPDLNDYTQAVSGGPIFLKDGAFRQDCYCDIYDCTQVREKGMKCEEFTLDWKRSHYDTVRMPRTAVGYDAKKETLIAVQIDGYAPGWSIGATQRELADVFLEFGATTAMELDGGGSSTIVLKNQTINRPSDGGGFVERRVPNALLFYWNGSDTAKSPKR
jgi:Phosphodiester glycosidase